MVEGKKSSRSKTIDSKGQWKSTRREAKIERGFYAQYLGKKKVVEGLQNGVLFEGSIRYNAADVTQAFCSIEGLPNDVFVNGPERQNRAVHGDIVVIRILPEKEWYEKGSLSKKGKKKMENLPRKEIDAVNGGQSDEDCDGLSMMAHVRDLLGKASISENALSNNLASLEDIRGVLQTRKVGWCATGEVVCIKKLSERRSCIVGCIQDDRGGPILVPLDKRLPIGRIVDSKNVYDHTKEKNSFKAQHYYEAKIVSWHEKDKMPQVQLKCMLGKPGKLETDIQALLIAERITDDALFDEKILKCLPESPWKIPKHEFPLRKDLRKARIFSIDPETAKDLDDALSIEILSNKNYRVGVHIADVSYFVKPGSELDKAAQARSTSVYLVDRVIPMLPRMLCEELCSLNPGTDRLAMSIIWEMDSDGYILDIWFGRTIIKSCVKLSYQMAQAVIDIFESSGQVLPDFKDVCIHGDHSPCSIAEDITLLHTLAKKLRKQRYSNGALRLDNSKVMVKLTDGEPEDFGLYQTGSANHLVEEFMLAANISAANLISESYPDGSLLRMHPEPNLEKLINTSTLFATWMPDAPKICTDSAGSVQESLKELSLFYQDTPEVMEAITFLCTKPMQMAQYFNTGDVEERALWRHYALSIPLYTHFTSPIRRYPDIIVHRLILGALEKKSKPKLGAVSVSEVAEHANERKTASKVIQERVTNLYLVKLLEKSPRVAFGVVSGLGGPKFFDVYIPEIGVDIRINVNEMYIRDIERVQTKWNPNKKVLLIKEAEETGPRMTLKPIYFNQNILNPLEIKPSSLPINLAPFQRIPLIIYGKHGDFGNLDTLGGTIFFG